MTERKRPSSSSTTIFRSVAAWSGYGDFPIADRAMKAGAVDFLSKPFSDDLLLQAVERAIAKGQSM